MQQKLFYKKYKEHNIEESKLGDISERVFNSFLNHCCPNCNTKFQEYSRFNEERMLYDNSQLTGTSIKETWKLILLVCNSCGWWQVTRKGFRGKESAITHDIFTFHSILERVDPGSDRMAMINLRQKLQDNWKSHKDLSSAEMAELVRDILKEHYSCDVIHTKSHVNTPDGGIDLLIAHDGTVIKEGVQVKRRLNGKPESISYVRDFLGALMIKGLQKGTFVTTSERFTKDVVEAQAILYKNSKIELNLIDAGRLLELLNATTPTQTLNFPLGFTEHAYWTRNDRYYTTLEAILGLPGNKL
jgi:hypothetical protein